MATRALLGHELRNPIAAIRSATELLSRIDLPAPQLPRLQRILDRQSLQTTKLIDGLLDVARITRGKVELDTAPLDVVELVRQVIEDRRSQFRERRLEVQLAEPEVWIVADRVKLVQVLDNLLSNALEFSSSGGLVRVEVHAEENNGTIVICDDGVGIEPNVLPCIFEPFRQGRPRSPSAQGGLGLALVKGLVELHGYRLHAHSDGVGQGARFEIEFATTAPPSHSSPESSIQVRHLQVLLVEDNPDVAETLTELNCCPRANRYSSGHIRKNNPVVNELGGCRQHAVRNHRRQPSRLPSSHDTLVDARWAVRRVGDVDGGSVARMCWRRRAVG